MEHFFFAIDFSSLVLHSCWGFPYLAIDLIDLWLEDFPYFKRIIWGQDLFRFDEISSCSTAAGCGGLDWAH
eukprot:scaffold129935_cov61-Attheya_sp.AAC.1